MPDASGFETGFGAGRVTWPNGAVATAFSAEDPYSLRGPKFDAAWCDELGAWRYPDAYDQLQFGLRLGMARQIVTTTPRPTKVIRDLRVDSTTHVTRGRTLDSTANLAPAALAFLFGPLWRHAPRPPGA